MNPDDPGYRDPRRSFTRAEVHRAWELQGRVCKLCRRSLPVDLMHGDHINPWIRGGFTVMTNLQALCGSCNLRKGSRPQQIIEQFFDVAKCAPAIAPLRRWQSEAMQVVSPALQKEPVLVEACPGAGKTTFGLTVAYCLLESRAISRVLIVAPTLGIVDGWLRAASAAYATSPTLPLRGPRDWRPVNPIGDEWVGAVFTYQSLFAMTDMFLAHATDPGHRTLVLFDEVHHAGIGSGWGQASQTAFSREATAVLSLSGTPFRTDRDPIVFIPSADGAAKPHYRYSYRDAIVDGACRSVQFVEVRGRTTFRTEDGEEHEVSFDDDDLSDLGARRWMRAALEWIEPGSIADKMLQDANEYLIGLRAAGDDDAAGLVVCVDCEHADRVAAHMEEYVLRTRPVVACSRSYDANDPDPADAIDRFDRGHDPWIVAVNMISEGVDIRRLRVVVYLTNRMTLLSFRQIVGRVVRSDPANVDDQGRVYLPADRRLLEMAREITNEVDILPPPMIIETDSMGERHVRVRDETRTERVEFEVLRTSGEQGAIFDTSGNLADAALVNRARQFICMHKLTGTDAESLALLARQRPALLSQLLECGEDK
jgi:superfamily II DNA or RNA helicase